jgi:phosphonate metabolism-associated iron-containing alcohol dehydrogenase
MAWKYNNPVHIEFGVDRFDRLPDLIAGRRYALITYGEPVFDALTAKLERAAGTAALIVRDVAPNPDCRLLSEQASRFAVLGAKPEVLVALGGGSVIDSAKVFAAAAGDFGKVKAFLETKRGGDELSSTPIIAVPTTAGTGSEVTCWGTVWDEVNGKKYSLARPDLYPTHALIDPKLMLGKPVRLTISTGLDALSHAFESIWNVSANPVSANHAVFAARTIMEVLPKLAKEPGDLELRSRMAMAALFAGLAFSNTKTAIAHSLSYPITLRHGVQHGIACSFTLPMIVRSLAQGKLPCQEPLRAILGQDLMAGADRLEVFFGGLAISTMPASYGIDHQEWIELLGSALDGERGQNFIGSREALLAVDPFEQPDRQPVSAK